MKTLIAFTAGALALATAGSAEAAVYDFTFGNAAATVTGSGTFTIDTSTTSSTGYLASAATGSVTVAGKTYAISGLSALGTVYAARSNDNLLFPTGASYVDANGLAFTLTQTSGAMTGATAQAIDLFFGNFQSGGTVYQSQYGGAVTSITAAGGPITANSLLTTLTLTPEAGAVPEPATWAMMLAGFSLVGVGLRRRNRFVQAI